MSELLLMKLIFMSLCTIIAFTTLALVVIYASFEKSLKILTESVHALTLRLAILFNDSKMKE